MENLSNTLIIIDFVTRGILILFFIATFIILGNILRQQSKMLKNRKEDVEFIRNFNRGLKELYKDAKELHEEREEMRVQKVEAEKEGKIKEKEEIIKKLRTEAGEVKTQKADVERAFKNFADQFAELLILISKIIYYTRGPLIIEKLISNMEEGFAKDYTLVTYKKAKQELEKNKFPYSLEILDALLKHPGLFLPNKDKSSSQK